LLESKGYSVHLAQDRVQRVGKIGLLTALRP
jgi:hypothetical protein